jgi:hypothetical protein
MIGVLQIKQHPELPTCEDCQTYVYDADWRKTERRGLPVLRASYGRELSLPCHMGKCPKSTDRRPNPGAELNGKNWLAYTLYTEIKAGRPMPDDAIVVRNCGLIRLVEDRVAAMNQRLAAFKSAMR